MANRVSSRKLVGRHEELDLLAGLLERAAAGEGGAAVVTGGAGVGKSRLVAGLARRAREEGALPLVGECVDLAEAELPYAPVVGALRAVVCERTEPELHRLLGSARPELARLLPELGEPAGAEGSGGQARLFELLVGVLSRLGREQPVLLVFEDVHWADAATMDLVGFLVRNQRAERLATVLTLRSDELGPEDPLRQRIAEVERSARALRIDLEPLSRDEVAAQAAEITGAATPAAVAERLYERAQGNPFFTEELLAAGVEGELPASLRDALLARVRRLSDPARDALGVAAVAGRTVDHRLLAAVSTLPERELVGALRDAVANHVLVSDGLRYAFRHALLRDAVYADLLAGQRAPLHAALAEALAGHPELAEARATSEAEIAHHWSAAGADGPALAASVRAGAQAARVHAVADSRRHYERALELWERVDEPATLAGIPRSELLRRAADAVWLAGDEPGAVALARAALEEPGADDHFAALVHGRLSTYLWGSGNSEEGLWSARRAVELLPAEPPSADRARALVGVGAMLVMRSENAEALERCEEALATARAAGARDAEGDAHNYLGGALAFLGDEAGAIEHLRDAVAILRTLGAGARGCPEYENLSEILSNAGRHEEALDLAREGIATARELGVERSYGVVLRGRAALGALPLGQLEEVERLTDEAFELGGETFFAFNALEARARCALLRGDLATAEARLAIVRAMAEQFGDAMWIGPIAAVRAELELWRREPERAAEIAAVALAVAPERQSPAHTAELHANGARAHADRAAAASALRDPGLGEAAARAAAELRDRLVAQVATAFPLGGPSARTRAEIALCTAEAGRAQGSPDSGPWRAAVAACDAYAHRPRAAYARWRLAEALLEQGDREGAAQALAAAAGIEHVPLAAELEALARRARLPHARAAPGEAEFGLTPRELDVLRLLAEGLTNREIAGRLYISEKTAEHHVSRILGKLGVRTRGAASSLAHRAGVEALGPPR